MLALQEVGITLPDGFVRYGGLHEEDGYRSMSQMLDEELRPDALFAVNDPVAIGAFQRIKEAGLKIPADIAIVGFSNNKITALIDPPLTTVNQNSFEMGKKAAEILIRDIEQGSSEPQTYTLESELIVRSST
jgi:LacI family transcriptional regulator